MKISKKFLKICNGLKCVKFKSKIFDRSVILKFSGNIKNHYNKLMF